MLSIGKLKDSLGLSDSAVRRRIDALNGVIDDHIKRGKKSKILVDSSGLEILKRLEGLRKGGATIEEAVSRIKEEMGSSEEQEVTGKVVKPSDNQRKVSEKEELLREQIEQLQNQVGYLRNQVEKKDAKLDEKVEQLHRYLPNPKRPINHQSKGFGVG